MQDSDFRTEIGSRKNTRLSAVLCASGARWKTFQLAMAFSFACEILNLIKHQGTSGNTRGLQFHVASSTEVALRNAARRVRFPNEPATSRSYLSPSIKTRASAYPSAHGNLDRLLEQFDNIFVKGE
jgi:hypothetical protein